MKWFVTDGKLEAMWREISHTLRNEVEATLRARHDAEIQRLRDDRAAELARVADPAQPFVTHLREEVAFWRLLYTAERQRNDVSVDQRLAEHRLGAITLPPRPLTPESPMPGSLEELLRSTELGAIGQAEGVER